MVVVLQLLVEKKGRDRMCGLDCVLALRVWNITRESRQYFFELVVLDGLAACISQKDGPVIVQQRLVACFTVGI